MTLMHGDKMNKYAYIKYGNLDHIHRLLYSNMMEIIVIIML